MIVSAHKDEKQLCLKVLVSSLDYEQAQLFYKEARALIDKHALPTVQVDMSQVDYISSAGLLALQMLQQEMHRQEGHLRLCGVSTRIRKMMQLVNMECLFEDIQAG